MTDLESYLEADSRSYRSIQEKVDRLQPYENMAILVLQVLKASEDMEAAEKELTKIHNEIEYRKFNETLELMKRDIGILKDYRLEMKTNQES